ncbi:MAG: Precorrin-3B methylase [Cyanothece sp. SIO1E1]|nr:Precorrin-3B methylase [Cyanothece sp. SIO1E1]
MQNAKKDVPLTGDALVKEVCRRIRMARSYWDAHNNRACRGERDRALQLYNTLTKAQKEQIPQVLRVWLRYRSEKYFGPQRTPPQGKAKSKQKAKRKSQH